MTNKLYEADLFILNINNPYIKVIVHMNNTKNERNRVMTTVLVNCFM